MSFNHVMSSISFLPCKRFSLLKTGGSAKYFQAHFEVLETPVKVALNQVACLKLSILFLGTTGIAESASIALFSVTCSLSPLIQ